MNNDQELRQNYSLLTSKKCGDTAISAPADTVTAYDNVNHLHRSDIYHD